MGDRMNKRDFLRFMGLAPVAAPMLANSVVEAVTKENIPNSSIFSLNTTKILDEVTASESDSLLAQLTYYKERLEKLNGIREEPNYQLSNEYKAAYYADSFVSVSKSFKLQLLSSEKARLDHLDELEHVGNTLERIKKRLGILGVLF